ncbi:MAG TPA: FAD:protein FMN transferase [Casimicrobiaceae bacterium]|nr:FAD:protein FMN transferase [Casimicrobiaceae bacterium]
MQLYRFEFAAMASRHELKLWAEHEPQVQEAAAAAIADVHRIERKYSRYRDDSVTSSINRAAGVAAVEIDAETRALLDYASACHALSQGAFDITSGVLRRAWDFRRDPPMLPDARTIEELLALIDWTAVVCESTRVYLPRAGMELDFGGIGKEYAADRAARICTDAGIVHGLVNLGGDVRVIGPQPDGTPWQIGIRHPRAEAVIASIPVREGALATSGDYQRFFEIDGARYCHVIDARTGWPVSAWQSVSVIAPLCTMAGSCATIAMLRARNAEAFLQEQGVDYLAIDREGVVHGTLARVPTEFKAST